MRAAVKYCVWPALLCILCGCTLLNVFFISTLHDLEAAQSTTTDTSRRLPYGGEQHPLTVADSIPQIKKAAGRRKGQKLSCEAHGGPHNADEMVYWRTDAWASEHQFETEYTNNVEEPKYLVLEPDEAGFSNVRLSFETVVAMAKVMGRTLVLPPKFRIAQLLRAPVKSYDLITDFFDLSELPVMRLEEYLKREALEGRLRNLKTGEVTFPPDNRTDWNGRVGNSNNANRQDGPRLFGWLAGAMPNLDFQRDECIVTFPSPSDSNSTDQAELEALLKKEAAMNLDVGKRIQRYFGKPLPINASKIDRLQEIVAHRTKICPYNETFQNARSVFQTGQEESGRRPLIPFYAYLFLDDWKRELQLKRFLRDHLRFADHLQCAAARIVQGIRERSPDKSFDSMHVRRTDFQDLPTYRDGVVGAEKIVQEQFFDANRTLYIATDEKNVTYFDPLRKTHTVLFLHDFESELEGVDPNMYGMIEQLVCARGGKFVGTFYSTFSAYINRLRGYHAQNVREPGSSRGVLATSEYFGHNGAYRAVHKQYATARGQFWIREWPSAWRDIDFDFDLRRYSQSDS